MLNAKAFFCALASCFLLPKFLLRHCYVSWHVKLDLWSIRGVNRSPTVDTYGVGFDLLIYLISLVEMYRT